MGTIPFAAELRKGGLHDEEPSEQPEQEHQREHSEPAGSGK